MMFRKAIKKTLDEELGNFTQEICDHIDNKYVFPVMDGIKKVGASPETIMSIFEGIRDDDAHESTECNTIRRYLINRYLYEIEDWEREEQERTRHQD